MESPVAEKQKPTLWAGSLNSGAGLGIIFTINVLFVIGFFWVCISIGAPTKAPIKNRFGFVMAITKNHHLANRGFVICGVRSTYNGLRSTYSG